MSEHICRIVWQRHEGEAFLDGRYRRAHEWIFDGGMRVAASASPDIVPPPYAEPANVDPEEAYVAALASCHMLIFLHLAAERGWVVDSYADEPRGVLAGAPGEQWMATVHLDPTVGFRGPSPAPAEIRALHEEAHALCFLARSVRSDIRIGAGDGPATVAPADERA